MAANTVYVITGANRGLGLGLTKALLGRPSTTVIATVRNGEAVATLQSETDSITAANKTTLYILKLDFSSAVPPEKIIETFNAATGAGDVSHADVLICNAASVFPMAPSAAVKAEHLRAAFEANTIASLLVFQAFWPLLQKSPSRAPKVVMVTSSLGCITNMERVPAGAYGPSKAALNYLAKSLHTQHEAGGLIAVALHPGWVQTRAGQSAAKDWGFPGEPPVSVDDSVKGMLDVIDKATRETASGKFVTQTGDVMPW
ncbi:short chain dehydrogenase/ reductase [Durotheca rogersii]|uniref:short chain dehydrogenase/ reductase n=1 Tax=Durotheca rogersii TaxID=419775 RepID=UPI0022202EA4|nr:short chain dehydrogenase/ reductase [Durotheca rogersii]KAI5861939.1 short chain dehydrogenase/ reductase [Durotheca rogersii]